MRNKKIGYAKKYNLITYALVLALFVFCEIFVLSGAASNLFKGLLVPICVNILLAISLNLVVGVSGELSLGHAGFMCIGAYVGSVFSVCMQSIITSSYIRFPLALLVGGIVAGIFGFIIGIPVLRLRGDYLAIVTLAFGEIIKNIFNNLYFATDVNGTHLALSIESYNKIPFDLETKKVIINGSMGISGTPNDSNFIICFIVIMIALFVILNLINSRYGRAIMASRDNRIAAESMGIDVTKSKMIAFVVSSIFAGIAGVLYSHNLHSLTAARFDYNQSILILVFVVLGGMGNIRGSIVAASILTALPELLRGLRDYRMLIYAIVLIAMMLLNNNDQFKLLVSKLSYKNLKTKIKGGAKHGSTQN